MKKIFIFIIILLFFITGLVFVIKNYKYPLREVGFQLPYPKGIKPDNNYDAKYSEPMTVIKSVDILHYSEPKANKIMLDFAKKDLAGKLSNNPEELDWQLQQIEETSVHAFEFDLNDDGVNEVIGLPPATGFYAAPWGAEFFILKKQGTEYVEIENRIIYTYEDKLVIFKEKTNGYHHMQFRVTGYPEPKHLIKYDKGEKCFRFYFYKYLNKK